MVIFDAKLCNKRTNTYKFYFNDIQSNGAHIRLDSSQLCQSNSLWLRTPKLLQRLSCPIRQIAAENILVHTNMKYIFQCRISLQLSSYQRKSNAFCAITFITGTRRSELGLFLCFNPGIRLKTLPSTTTSMHANPEYLK